MFTSIVEHPEKIAPTLPVHAMLPVVEPGEPVRKAMIAEAAYYRADARSVVITAAAQSSHMP